MVCSNFKVKAKWEHTMKKGVFIFRLLDVVNDNPDVFYRQAWKPLVSTAIEASAEFLGADPNNVVLVQNATTGK